MSAEEIHKHKPRDIKPQGHGSGFDADKLDGLHASEISGGGGGPHASTHETGGGDKVHFSDLEHSSGDATLHDSLTSTPHISQGDKDKIHNRQHDHSLGEDGSPIAVAGVPNLPASKITSERLSLSRMPEGTLNYFLKAQGAGVDPLWALLQASDIPNLDASKITTGILNEARGGLSKALSPTWTNDYIPVYKTATDNFVMEAKPSGGVPPQTVEGTINASTQSTSFEDIAQMSITVAESGTYEIKLSININMIKDVNNTFADVFLRFIKDSTELIQIVGFRSFTDVIINTLTFHFIRTLNAGEVVKAQWKLAHSNDTAINNAGSYAHYRRILTITKVG